MRIAVIGSGEGRGAPRPPADLRYLRMLADVPRFHRAARAVLEGGDGAGPTLGAFLTGYSPYFVALFLIACDHWAGLLTVLSPLVMTFFLVKGTGKPLLEKGMRKTRPGYAEYAARTSGFFPLPPRRSV
jgi:hypothetical protein